MSDDHDAVEEGEILRPSQRRRVEALQVAKDVLVSKAGIFGGSKVEESRAVDDLITLADYVLVGSDESPTVADGEWHRRQGYVEGVKQSMTVMAAGGGTNDLNELLGNDALAEYGREVGYLLPPVVDRPDDHPMPDAGQILGDALKDSDTDYRH